MPFRRACPQIALFKRVPETTTYFWITTDKIDDNKNLNDNEFENLLEELNEEIRSQKLTDKKMVVDKNESETILMEIQDGKLNIIKMTDLRGPPMTMMTESMSLRTIPRSIIRKYATKKNIESLLSL
jgi:hypothetical protein